MDADVVIIGAGASGLAAARDLARTNRVIVVEAQPRYGGRAVWTTLAETVYADLGPEFIHGTALETTAILRAIGQEAISSDGDSWTWTAKNGLQRDDENLIESATLFAKADTLTSDESVEQFLRRLQGIEPVERVERARRFVEGFDAADPAIASAQAIAAEIGSGADSSSTRPPDGYAPVFNRLFAECRSAGVHFAFSQNVTRVAWGGDHVTIEGRTPAGTYAFHSRAAVITVSVGVLKDDAALRFDPLLPAPKREALRFLEMGHVVKVALAFRNRFWETVREGRFRDAAFFQCSGHPFGVYWTQYPERKNLIVAWSGGPKAAALENRPQGDLIRLACDGFGEILGAWETVRTEFVDGAVHDWFADPFARGAYSYVVTGGGNARAALAQPVHGQLFFAGEATSTDGQGGTVNGALEAGRRAAAEVMQALEGP